MKIRRIKLNMHNKVGGFILQKPNKILQKMTNGTFSISKNNSPKRSIISPNTPPKCSYHIVLQEDKNHTTLSRQGKEFSKEAKGQDSWNSLYRSLNSLYSNKLIQFITHSLSESGLLRGDKTVLNKSLFTSLFSLFTINFSLK